jgi:hypothetical protein
LSNGRLTPLQVRLLQVLAPLEPPWTLTGGAALAAVHTQHRETRDLDLFWREQSELGDVAVQAEGRIRAAGHEVETSRSGPAFVRLRVRNKTEEILVDLVAEPMPPTTTPDVVLIAGVRIHVDTAHEILTEKLCALLERSEIRDLLDIKTLVDRGVDLKEALAAAPRKDSGFSALTVAWLLRDFPLDRLAHASGWTEELTRDLDSFRQQLLTRLLSDSAPAADRGTG